MCSYQLPMLLLLLSLLHADAGACDPAAAVGSCGLTLALAATHDLLSLAADDIAPRFHAL